MKFLLNPKAWCTPEVASGYRYSVEEECYQGICKKCGAQYEGKKVMFLVHRDLPWEVEEVVGNGGS